MSVTDNVRRRIVTALGGVMPPKPVAVSPDWADPPLPEDPVDREAISYVRTVYHIERGHVRELHFFDRTALPEHAEKIWYDGGNLDGNEVRWKLDHTLRVVARCAPWLRVYAGARLVMQDGGDVSNPSGLAVKSHTATETSAILMRLGLARNYYMSTLHHEIWHAVEHDALSDGTIARITKACRLGKEYAGNSYLQSDDERRARAYAHYASLRDEMPQMHVRSEDTRHGQYTSLADVFESVYSGELARSLGCDFRGRFDAPPGEAAREILASRGLTEDRTVGSRETVLSAYTWFLGCEFGTPAYDAYLEFLGHAIETDRYVRNARAE